MLLSRPAVCKVARVSETPWWASFAPGAGSRDPAGGIDAIRRGGGAGFASRIDEIDGIDAVATATLGEIKHVVKNRHAAEIIVFPDLIGLAVASELVNVETGNRGGSSRSLGTFRLGRGDMICAPAPRMIPTGWGLEPLPALPAV